MRIKQHLSRVRPLLKARQSTKPPKKQRGKKAIRRQRMSGCMIGLIYSAAVVCISVVLACLGWVAATDVFALNKDYITATVVIEENYTIDSVADELYDKGLIEYKFLFKLFAAFARVEEEQKIDPGTYQLNTTYDYRALVSNMQQLDEMDEDPNVVTVSFPEGMTIKQVFALLEENGVCSYDELLEAATNYDFDYEFLDSLELGNENRLEGYLFPDTYEFYLNESAEVAISRFLDNFNRKVSTQMYETAEDLGYSMHDIIIIASLIEKEASGDADRTDIASVIYNRLNSSDFPETGNRCHCAVCTGRMERGAYL